MRHEKTFVYQKSLALMQTAQLAIKHFPQGFGFLADQLRRNTSSVHHNFAEGYYQESRRQQRRFSGTRFSRHVRPLRASTRRPHSTPPTSRPSHKERRWRSKSSECSPSSALLKDIRIQSQSSGRSGLRTTGLRGPANQTARLHRAAAWPMTRLRASVPHRSSKSGDSDILRRISIRAAGSAVCRA